MDITIFTVFTSFLWVNLFMGLIIFLGRRREFYRNFSLYVLLMLILLCILKVFVVVEFPFIIVINSTRFMIILMEMCRYPVFTIDIGSIEFNIVTGYILVIFSVTGTIIFAWKNFKRCSRICRFFDFMPETKDDNVNEILKSVKKELNIEKRIKVVIHNKIQSPAVIGYFKPVIILPDLEFTKDELKGILLHEGIHCKYKHVIIKFIVEVIKILLWWNPLVHIFAGEVNKIFEFHVDKKLSDLLNEEEKESYLKGIIKVIENCQQKGELSSIAIGLTEENDKENMVQRFKMILENMYSKKHIVKNLALVLPVLFMFFTSYLFVIMPYGEPTYEDFNDGAPVITPDCYIVKNEDGYVIYDPSGNILLTFKGEIDEKYYYLEVRESGQ